MSSQLITNIGLLAGVGNPQQPLRGAELSQLPALADTWLVIEDGHIASFGRMDKLPAHLPGSVTDANKGFILPAWCDSHTHLVFPASRELEFIDKIKGRSYAEIAANGGGILNSARVLEQTSEQMLYEQALKRMNEIAALGTASVEIKTGYGLSKESELKMLRVIRRLKTATSMNVKATFLGAHTYPLAFREDHEAYIRLLTEEMLPIIAAEKLADFIDVFCENGFFSQEETEHICQAGLLHGLRAKIHANQLSLSGGVQAGVNVNALSVDHLETMDDGSISLLAGSATIGTLLPTAALFLRMQMPPARQLIDRGAAIALATDYNPGSSPSGNMNLVIALGCIQMRMLPEEALNAATINGAFAMQLQDITGSITSGKQADLILTRPVPSLAYLPYAFGTNHIAKVMLRGQWLS